MRPSLRRSIAAALLLLWLPAANPAEMHFVETENLRVINFGETGAHLVPYATQSFLNALAAQQARLGYTPDGKPTVLLQDFSDKGTASVVGHAAEQGLFQHSPADARVRNIQSG